jgi:hypothetical protein
LEIWALKRAHTRKEHPEDSSHDRISSGRERRVNSRLDVRCNPFPVFRAKPA